MINKLNYFIEWYVYNLNRVDINIYLYFDWISLIFIFTVLLISSIIIFYCIEYIEYDKFKNRFFFLVFLFVLSIILIILSPNIIRILIGWDGLGLISYCLVIYYQNYSRYNSGILTIIINRIGDVMILMRISILFILGRWNFIIFDFINYILIFFIIVARFTKRAQFPFSSWLPAAIAAPTPVSSLVHSSTLVTAGIYLLIRFNYLIYKNDLLLNYIIIIGLLTIMLAGLSANIDYDLKKIIAYSTLSQLGLIIIIYSLKNLNLVFFHLIIHAIFKSIIFICSGIIIHNIINFQDIRFIGNIKNIMPITLIILIISNFSLCGLPFISGFYSKDQILEIFIIIKFSLIIYIIIIIGTIFTVIYRVRLLYYLVNSEFKFFPLSKIYDCKLINFSIIILILITIIFGRIINWIIYINIEFIYIKIFEKILIIFLCLLSIYLRIKFYKIQYYKNDFVKYFFGKIWFLYNLNFIFIKDFILFRKFYIKLFDKGWREEIVKNLMFKISKNIGIYNINNNIYIYIILLLRYFVIIFIIF